MGRDTLNTTQLEDFIVRAFQNYERGLWPISARHEAKLIINACKIVVDNSK